MPARRDAVTRKVKVLFVCIGNAVRSQMAEAFARHYGGDAVAPSSAGLAPAQSIAPLTMKVLRDRGISVREQFPKGLGEVNAPFDYVVNISGEKLPPPFDRGARNWDVADPYVLPEQAYLEAAAKIESLVMSLLMEIRGRRVP